MNAITQDILNIKVENINYALGLTSNKYFIQKAYGGYRLCKTTNEAGGCADITERMTKKEQKWPNGLTVWELRLLF